MEDTTPTHVPGSNRYAIIDKHSTQVVKTGLRTRKEARAFKRGLEEAHKASNNYESCPVRYTVETDVDNPAGAGIYIH